MAAGAAEALDQARAVRRAAARSAAAARAAAASAAGALGRVRQRRRRPLLRGAAAGYGGDVGRDRGGVGARDELLRHRRRRVVDLVVDDLLDRALAEVLLAYPCECTVEIWPLLALRSGVLEPVAAAAALHEELLALTEVAALRDARLAAAGAERGHRQGEESGGEDPQALRRRLARVPDPRDRLVARRVDAEHAVEPGDLEDLRDVAVAADERQLTIVRPEALDAADEDAERRRVDERRVGEVDNHVLAALRDHVEQLLLELRRRVQVDLARERDHVRASVDLLR